MPRTIETETVDTLLEGYFNGSKSAFGAIKTGSQLVGTPWQESGRGWCNRIAWLNANTPYTWRYRYEFAEEGLYVATRIMNPETLEDVRVVGGDKLVTANVRDGKDLERVGLVDLNRWCEIASKDYKVR